MIDEKQLDLYSKLLEVSIRSVNEGILPPEFVKTTLQNEYDLILQTEEEGDN